MTFDPSLPAWAAACERARNLTAPGMIALAQQLRDDPSTPVVLASIARRFLGDGLFDDARVIPSRTTDPVTSRKAEPGKLTARNMRTKLLRGYVAAEQWPDGLRPDGLTDEGAAEFAGVPLTSEYAKRCSELREAGYLEPTGEERRGAAGMARMVCRITDAGRDALAALDAQA